MPCGHALSPYGLTEHIKSELGKKRDKVRCPVEDCERVWPLEVLKKYSCATQVETWFMEMKLSDNACKKSPSIVNCPQCESLCTPNNPSRVDVECIACRAKGETVIFCYKCLHMCTWQKHTSKYVYKNRDCISNGGKNVLKILKEAPEKKVIGVSCPSIRACPSCGTLIEHEKYCKHMTCRECKTDFCFLCLKMKPKDDSGWGCGYAYDKCKVAPCQNTHKTCS